MSTPESSTSVTAPTVDDIADSVGAPDESLWERRMRAATMRNAGRTYDQIAKALTASGTPVSAATVRKDVRKAYQEIIAESREDMIARQRSVLLDFQRTNYVDAINTDPTKFDNRIAAQKMIVAGMEHEAKLFGLYSPTRVSLGISDAEFAEETARLISEMGLQPPKELTRAISSARGEAVEAEVLPFDLAEDPDDDDDALDVETVEVQAAQANSTEVESPALNGAEDDPAPVDDGWSNI